MVTVDHPGLMWRRTHPTRGLHRRPAAPARDLTTAYQPPAPARASQAPAPAAWIPTQRGPVPQAGPVPQGRPGPSPQQPHAAQYGSGRVLRPYQPRSFDMPTRALPQIRHAQPVFVDDTGRRGLLLAWASIIVAVGALGMVAAFWLSQATTSPDVGGPPSACAAAGTLRCDVPAGV